MKILSALLVLCAGNSPATGEFPSPRTVTRGFCVFFCLFFNLGLNKRLSKQSRRRWFQMPSRSLWRHCKCIKPISTSPYGITRPQWVKTLKPEQNCRCLPVIFSNTSLEINVCILTAISLKFSPDDSIENNTANGRRALNQPVHWSVINASPETHL